MMLSHGLWTSTDTAITNDDKCCVLVVADMSNGLQLLLKQIPYLIYPEMNALDVAMLRYDSCAMQCEVVLL